MSWLAIIPSVVSSVGSAIGGFFGTKQKGLETIERGMDASISALNQLNSADQAKMIASSEVLKAVQYSGSNLEKAWRPILMCIFVSMLLSFWFFGYTPPYFDQPLSPILARIFDLIEIGLVGYIGKGTVEGVVRSVNVKKLADSILDKVVSKVDKL